MAFLGNQRSRALAYQLLFVGVIVVLLVAGAFVTHHNLKAQGITSGFDFLWRVTGWNIGVALLPAAATDPYWYVILLGFLNTLFAGLLGLLFATMVGAVVGLGRISENIPARTLAALYVETFRNTPLILQLFFWYALSSTLPPLAQSLQFAGIHLNNRGLFLPGFNVSGPAVALFCVALAATLSVLVWVACARRFRRMEEARKRAYLAGVALAGALCAFVLLWIGHVPGEPLVSWPTRRGLNFIGGYRIQPEVAVLIFAIAVYGGAYIAEIVRGGFLAVGRGQTEAARALGLSPWQSFIRVRLPLALRSMLPILSNQYIWLIKATTLGTVVGFSDIFLVIATGITQSGQTLEFIAILMGGFLVINLTLSRALNRVNRAIALKGHQLRT